MQSKRWVFTLNNYAESDFAHFHDAPDRAYVIIGKEVGESGTPYLQGYITFHKNKRLSPVKIIHPRAHWEIARESTYECIKYCSKDGDFHEVGERPKVGSPWIEQMMASNGSILEMKAAQAIVLLGGGRPWLLSAPRAAAADDADDGGITDCGLIVAGDSIVEVATENPEAYARGGQGLRELQGAADNDDDEGRGAMPSCISTSAMTTMAPAVLLPLILVVSAREGTVKPKKTVSPK